MSALSQASCRRMKLRLGVAQEGRHVEVRRHAPGRGSQRRRRAATPDRRLPASQRMRTARRSRSRGVVPPWPRLYCARHRGIGRRRRWSATASCARTMRAAMNISRHGQQRHHQHACRACWPTRRPCPGCDSKAPRPRPSSAPPSMPFHGLAGGRPAPLPGGVPGRGCGLLARRGRLTARRLAASRCRLPTEGPAAAEALAHRPRTSPSTARPAASIRP